jgi:DNA-binding response OmpR family regulator
MPRILLVDDDPDILQVLGATFESAGHQVLSTTDPRDIEDILARHELDALILDVMMPNRNGWEVLADLRRNAQTRRLPIMMLSAIGDTTSRVRGLRGGADDFLTKPFDPEEVLVRIEGLLARRNQGSDALQGSLRTFSLAEVLQTLQQNRARGTVEITTASGRGAIAVDDGRILSAQFARLRNTDAILAMLGCDTGSFRLTPELPPGAAKDGKPINVQALLLEAAWIADETNRRALHLPKSEEALRFARGGTELKAPSDLPDMPVGWVLLELQRSGPTTLAALGQIASVAPSRLKLAVAWLLEQGYLATAAPKETLEAVALPPANANGGDGAGIPPQASEQLARVVAVAQQRGFGANPSLALLIHPRAWASFPSWLVGLARHNNPGARPVSVRLDTLAGDGSLEIVFRSLAGNLEDSTLIDFAGIILWFGGEDPASVSPAIQAGAAYFHRRALRLVVSPTPRKELPSALQSGEWNQSAEIPGSFADMMSAMLPQHH